MLKILRGPFAPISSIINPISLHRPPPPKSLREANVAAFFLGFQKWKGEATRIQSSSKKGLPQNQATTKTKNMKIYIAGKVTGLPRKEAERKFEKSKRQLQHAGIPAGNIENPMEFGIRPHDDWHKAMRVCLPRLRNCDAVYVQNDWRDSFGARRELAKAAEWKKIIYYEEENDIVLIINQVMQGTL